MDSMHAAMMLEHSHDLLVDTSQHIATLKLTKHILCPVPDTLLQPELAALEFTSAESSQLY